MYKFISFIFIIIISVYVAEAQVVGGQGTFNETSKPKSSEPNYILKNGFFADFLFQGVFGRVNLLNYGSFTSAQPALSLGSRVGNLWYFGKSNTYRPGLAAIWGRANYNFEEDAAGDIRVVISLNLLNVGFASAVAFNDKIGIEGSLNVGPNITAGFEPSSFYVFGWSFSSTIKFRYKKIAVGLDLCITNGTDSEAQYTLSNTYFGLTIGTKGNIRKK